MTGIMVEKIITRNFLHSITFSPHKVKAQLQGATMNEELNLQRSKRCVSSVQKCEKLHFGEFFEDVRYVGCPYNA